ncbi:MAG: hypothetical protein QW179_00700 [Candidatus Hadarchaeales archaeon]
MRLETGRSKRIIGLVFGAIVFVTVFVSFALSLGPSNPQGSFLYSNPKWGFEIEIPSDYRIVDEKETFGENENGFTLSLLKSDEKFQITFNTGFSSRIHTLEEWVYWVKFRLERLQGLTMTSEHFADVLGFPGWEGHGTFSGGDTS